MRGRRLERGSVFYDESDERVVGMQEGFWVAATDVCGEFEICELGTCVRKGGTEVFYRFRFGDGLIMKREVIAGESGLFGGSTRVKD